MPRLPDLPLFDDVDPIPGEPRRFRVRSRSDPRVKYLVDLDEMGFNGQCGCDNFNFCHGSKIKEDVQERRPRKRRRCWHIVRAMIFYAELRIRMEWQHDERVRLKAKARQQQVNEE